MVVVVEEGGAEDDAAAGAVLDAACRLGAIVLVR